jgi:pyrroloquinoline quinone biosynthesis protein B
VAFIQKVWSGSSSFRRKLTLAICLGSLVSTISFSQESRFAIQVLGIAQDAGYPQMDCEKECCKAVRNGEVEEAYPTSLALIDREKKSFYLFEASPAIREQLQMVKDSFPGYALKGVFITHAHIGHYLGLAQFGREVMGAKGVPVYVMPRMKSFLERNGPWSQLIELGNISLMGLRKDKYLDIDEGLEVSAALVPHRDEYSETVGFSVQTQKGRFLFLPDIDSWEAWDLQIKSMAPFYTFMFLDATFYNDEELPGRDMSKIPHPRVSETMNLFADFPFKSRIQFIHFNHTNPVLRDTPERKLVLDKGFSISQQGMIIDLK